MDYASTRHEVGICAPKLKTLLRDILLQPAETLVNRSLPPGEPLRAPGSRYNSVILIGHSMGRSRDSSRGT